MPNQVASLSVEKETSECKVRNLLSSKTILVFETLLLN